MRFLKIFTVLALVSIIFGEAFRIYLGNNIFIKPQDILILISFLIFTFYSIKARKYPNSSIIIPIIIFSLIGLISMLVNSGQLNNIEFIASLSYLLRWIMYASMYMIIASFDKSFKKLIIKIMFLIGLVILLFGYLQYFLYPNLRNLYYLGWDEHNYRMFSVFLDPNFAGAFFVLYFLFTIGIISSKKVFKKIRFEYFMFLVAILTFIAVLLTYSRSAYLMLSVGIITHLILINKKKYITVSLVLFCIGLIALIPTFNKENTNLLRTTSSMARFETYENAIKIIKDKPILGVGFNAYRYAQQDYGFREENMKYINHADAGVDSSILFVLATTGFMGLSAYIFIWYKILRIAFIKINNNYGNRSVTVISSTLCLFVNSIFINSLFFPSIMLWMWMIIALNKDEKLIQH